MRFLRMLVKELVDDNVVDLGAMMAYYTILSLFPMILFVVSLALLVLPSSVLDDGVRMAAEAMPVATRALVVDRIQQLIHTANGGIAATGLVLSVWGASRGAASLGSALNRVYDLRESRSWIRRQLVAIGVTVAVAVLAVIALALLFAGPAVGHWLVDRYALGGAFDTAWSIARWLGAGLLVMLLWAIVYHVLPDTRARFRLFTPGAAIGVALWLVASWGFGAYLAHANSYEATYGTLGGVIIFLTWLWISNIALLLGAEIDDVRTKLYGPARTPERNPRDVAYGPMTPATPR